MVQIQIIKKKTVSSINSKINSKFLKNNQEKFKQFRNEGRNKSKDEKIYIQEIVQIYQILMEKRIIKIVFFQKK